MENKQVQLPLVEGATLKERLRNFMRRNASMAVEDVAALFCCTKQNVYQARHDAGVSKRIGRVVTRKSRVNTLKQKDDRIAELEKQIEHMKVSPNEKNVEADSEWKQKHNSALYHINHLEKRIDGFEKQVIGYKAVINYLEHQLAAAAEHGTPV